ncbi:tellurite resistance TerB family protein [Methyloligella sp. 2.7D]|uniref:tellurite resistance TerB family protein n=1 Tax=unclassified Methyloligella TaxID=2625955 RepID=UPI00157D91A4|nr:tellurite resistance TerB family protein [Methyloligella sp. GL2]QKP78492.1 tellurite resistance TerB family protein [Methyloligella sp. GL2]
MTDPLNHHEALIYVMVTMAAVDRAMSDAEFARIGETVSALPVFDDFETDSLVSVASACGDLLGEDDGLKRALGLIRGALPEPLRETAYACALEVAAADLDVPDVETRLLEMIADTLELDQLTKVAIERGIRARNMVL